MQFTSSFAILIAAVAASVSGQVLSVGLGGTGVVVGVPTTLPGGTLPTTTVAGGVLPTTTSVLVPTSVAIGTSTTLNGGTSTTVISSTSTSTSTGTDTSTSTSTSAAPTSTVIPANGSRANLVRVSHNKGNGAAFCRRWKSACVNYRPGGQLYFSSTYCLPGSYSGRSPTRLATVNCRFTNGRGSIKAVNHHVANQVGARIY